MYTLTNCAVIY